MTDPRLCLLCAHQLTPVELRTCNLCASLVRLDLTSIRHCFALLRVQVEIIGQPAAVTPSTVMGISASDGVTIPDALVMLGPGSASHIGDPSDPPAVTFELWQWAGDWCEIRREDPAGIPTKVPDLTDYLSRRLSWAMSYHPDPAGFAADMTRIRTRLEAVTGTSNAPERGASCPYDGAQLRREYGNQGRADDWTCPVCRRDFDEVQYRLALRAALEENRPAT